MAIDWSLFDPSYGAKLGAALDPALIQERQNKLADLAQERQMRQMQMQGAIEAQQAKKESEARRLAGIEEYNRTGTAAVPLEYNPDEIMAAVQAMPDSPEKQQTLQSMQDTGFGVQQQRALTPEEEYMRLQKFAIAAPSEARVPLSMFEFRQRQAEARSAQQEKLAAQHQLQQERLQAAEEARKDRAAMLRAAGGGAAPSWQTLQTDQGFVQVNPKTGEIRQLASPTGQPLTKTQSRSSMTEFQGKSLAFGTRAQDADKIFDKIGADYSPMAVNAAASVESVPGVGMGAYALLGDKEKQVMQAQRNFINAVLRQESGAVISPSEFDNARKQYFPQPGDDPATLAQKKANRQRIISTFKEESGPGAKSFSEEQPQSGGAVIRYDAQGNRIGG